MELTLNMYQLETVNFINKMIIQLFFNSTIHHQENYLIIKLDFMMVFKIWLKINQKQNYLQLTVLFLVFIIIIMKVKSYKLE